MSYKKIKQFTSWILLVYGLQSCSGSNKASDFNDRVSKIQSTILPEVYEFETQLQRLDSFSAGPQFLVNRADSLRIKLENEINETKALIVPEGGDNLQAAILKQFEFQKNLCKNIAILFNDSTSNEQKILISDRIQNTDEEEKRLTKNMELEKKEFAKKYKISIK